MYKYLLSIILGILIYILLNQYNSFSVGGPNRTRGQRTGEPCRRPLYIRRIGWTMSGDEINNGCDLGYVCKVDPSPSRTPQRIRSSFDGLCQSPQEDKNWDELDITQQAILTDLGWDKNSWDNPLPGSDTSRILRQPQYKHVLTYSEINLLRTNGMSDEFLFMFDIRGEPGALCRLDDPEAPEALRCDSGRACRDDGNCPITGDEDVDHLGTPGALCRPEGPSPSALRCDDGQGCLENNRCPIAGECDESRQCPEYFVCVNGKCMSTAGGGGGGGDDAAGPFCSSPDSGGPCAAAGGAAAAGGGGSLSVQPEIDASVSSIDLTKIEFDYRPWWRKEAPLEIEIDCRPMESDVKKKIRDLRLKYVSSGEADVSLTFVSYLSEGAYAYVCRYASHARDQKGEDNYIAVAVKFYKEDNSEAEIIELINTTRLRFCYTIAARVLDYPPDYLLEYKLKAGLMQLMDGDCLDMFTKYKHKDNIYLFFEQIVTDLKCISVKNYVYTDLKLANCLYKVQSNDDIVIKLGDLDSIQPMGKIGAVATYPTVEAFVALDKEEQFLDQIGDAPFIDLNIFWGIGCMAVEAYQKLEKTWLGRYQLQRLYNLISRPKVLEIARSSLNRQGWRREKIISDYYTSIDNVLTNLVSYIDPKLYRLFTTTLCSESIRGGTTYDEILEIVRTT